MVRAALNKPIGSERGLYRIVPKAALEEEIDVSHLKG